MKDELGRLPHNVFDTYAVALERIVAMPESMRTGLRILGLALHLRYAVTTSTLGHILATRLGDERFDPYGIPSQALESYAHGLLTVQNDKITFPHYTIAEFLRQDSIYEKYFAGFEEELTRTCMTYLAFDNFSAAVDDLKKRYQEFHFCPMQPISSEFIPRAL